MSEKAKQPARKKNDASLDVASGEAAALVAEFKVIRRLLLGWFRMNQRDFPWRKTSNWFHLLMAEMMLRRTRADQVRPVYERFTARFADPVQAARLKQAELEKFLEPLGLKWRATQLHGTIQFLRDNFESRGLDVSDNLQDIPGVGDYSEAMLRNRLFNEPRAAIDSNVVRIILRWQNKPFHADSRRNKGLIGLANEFVRSRNSKDLNLAMLDFSALVCKPRKPLCPECPLRAHCLFGQNLVS